MAVNSSLNSELAQAEEIDQLCLHQVVTRCGHVDGGALHQACSLAGRRYGFWVLAFSIFLRWDPLLDQTTGDCCIDKTAEK